MDYRWAKEEGQTGKGLPETALVVPGDGRLTAFFKGVRRSFYATKAPPGRDLCCRSIQCYCPAGALGAAAPGCAGGGGTPDFTL